MDIEFASLIGKTLINIKVDDDRIEFTTNTGEQFAMYHNQDCCESVSVEDVIGDINDLIGYPITLAKEATSDTNPPGITKDYQDSFTWTFYKLATIKGYVTIRWYGESNGYYSESVDFVQFNPLTN